MTEQLSMFSSPEPQPQSVSEITRYIKRLFETDPPMGDVWVEGEVSNYKRAASGHLYFSLKDPAAQLNCVMWKSAAGRLFFEPRHGDLVVARGRISVYEPQGAYQLYVDTLQPAGAGDLHQQLEILKAKLVAEGLFDEDRKRPIPGFPRRIGVVTSPDAAAFQDVLNVLSRRYPSAEIILSPTQVQGSTAPPLIVAAIEALNHRDDIDVMLVVRGGGSLEDLWSFNDERVVRAVADSRIPTIAGVGHEIDFTLVDFAADERAPTPSAAAEMASPDGEALRSGIQDIDRRMRGAIHFYLDESRRRIEQNQHTLNLLSPANRIATLRQKLDDQAERMLSALQNHLRLTRQEIKSQSARLESASPGGILKRGYAIVSRDADGTRLSSVQGAASGTTLRIQMHDGEWTATVRERKTHDE